MANEQRFILRSRDLAQLSGWNFGQNSGRILINFGPKPGSWRIHKRRLTPLHNIQNLHLSLDIRPKSPQAAEAYVVIPQMEVSRYTLEHIGLTPEAADDVWERWMTVGQGRSNVGDSTAGRAAFIAFVTSQLDSVEDATADNNNEQWHRCLTASGVDRAMRDDIMDPTCTQARRTHSCLFWIRSTLEQEYAKLQSYRLASRDRARQLEIAQGLLDIHGSQQTTHSPQHMIQGSQHTLALRPSKPSKPSKPPARR